MTRTFEERSCAPELPGFYSVRTFIDEQKLGAAHRWMLLICAVVMWVDSFDVFVVGKIAPAIASGFHAKAAAMTTVFLVQQIGLAIGAFAATPLADRFGRQRMIAISLVAFGLVSLLSSLSTSLRQLAVLRGIAGLFLSGLLPMVVALIAETTPRGRRGTYISIAFVAYSAGSAAGGWIAVWLLEHYGWQSVFWAGGAVPVLLVPLVLWALPESLLFLVASGASSEKIRAGVKRLDPTSDIPPGVIFRSGWSSKELGVANVWILFDADHRARTVILWAATFLSMGCVALLAAWLPTLFQEMAGIPIKQFAIYSLIGFVGSLAGALSSGWLLDRSAATTVGPVYYLGMFVSLLLLGWLPAHVNGFIVAVIGLMFFQAGGQAIINTLLSQIYPTSVRSTGIGWAGGVGRIGGVALPLFGGFALQSHFSISTTMILIGTIPMGVVVALLILRQNQTVFLPRQTRAA